MEQDPQVDGCIVIPEGFSEPRYAPRSSNNTKRKSRVGGRYFTELPNPDLTTWLRGAAELCPDVDIN